MAKNKKKRKSLETNSGVGEFGYMGANPRFAPEYIHDLAHRIDGLGRPVPPQLQAVADRVDASRAQAPTAPVAAPLKHTAPTAQGAPVPQGPTPEWLAMAAQTYADEDNVYRPDLTTARNPAARAARARELHADPGIQAIVAANRADADNVPAIGSNLGPTEMSRHPRELATQNELQPGSLSPMEQLQLRRYQEGMARHEGGIAERRDLLAQRGKARGAARAYGQPPQQAMLTDYLAGQMQGGGGQDQEMSPFAQMMLAGPEGYTAMERARQSEMAMADAAMRQGQQMELDRAKAAMAPFIPALQSADPQAAMDAVLNSPLMDTINSLSQGGGASTAPTPSTRLPMSVDRMFDYRFPDGTDVRAILDRITPEEVAEHPVGYRVKLLERAGGEAQLSHALRRHPELAEVLGIEIIQPADPFRNIQLDPSLPGGGFVAG